MIRYIILVLATICSSMMAAQSIYATLTMDACALVDEEGRIDSTRLGNNPDCICGVSDSGFRLMPNQFLSLDEGISNLMSGEFSMSFFISPRANTDQLIMLSGSDCAADSSFFIAYSAANHRLEINYRQNDIFFVRQFIDLDQTKCWNHIALTKSRTNYQFYLNGQLNSEIRNLVVDFAKEDFLRIGGASCGAFAQMDGAIDELRLYTGILSSVDVRRLFIETDFLETDRGIVLEGEPFQANVLNSCADNFEWTPASGIDDPTIGNATFTVNADAQYVLRMDQDGCSSFDTLDIIVADSSALVCDRLLLATAFTPNGDGINDQFGISNPFIVDELISFKMIDRWGEVLFMTSNRLDTWDASFKGAQVNAGVYIYEIVYICDGEERQKIGSVALLR